MAQSALQGFDRALVTGGAGFVGSHLCEQLLHAGLDVVCMDNLATGTLANIAHLHDNPRFRWLEHDVTRPFPNLGWFDLVAHLASPASPPDYTRLGVETLRAGADGTARALDVARDANARFILASTSEVYGDPAQHPQTESYWGNVNPIGPRSVYDEAKRYAEALTTAYHRKWGTDVAIARIFNTYGPRMRAGDGRMIPTFIQQVLDGKPLTVNGSGSQTRSICFVDDTVAGLLLLAGSGEHGPVNIGNPVEMTVTQIAELIRDLGKSSSTVRRTPAVPDDPQRRCPDISLARSVLEWEPRVGASEGLSQTLAWFAAQRHQPGAAPARSPSGAAPLDSMSRHPLPANSTGGV